MKVKLKKRIIQRVIKLRPVIQNIEVIKMGFRKRIGDFNKTLRMMSVGEVKKVYANNPENFPEVYRLKP